jgi:L-threonine kinase
VAVTFMESLLTQSYQISATSSVTARAGELLQGFSASGERWIVSGPVSPDRQVTVTLTDQEDSDSEKDGIEIDDTLWKSKQAIDLFYNLYHSANPDQARDIFYRKSMIPKGKGFGSSSADILAVLQVLNQHCNTKLDRSDLYKLAVQIEPTDPLLHSETLLFDSGRGEVVETLPALPLISFCFDARPDEYYATRDYPGREDAVRGTGRFYLMDRDEIVRAWQTEDLYKIFHMTTQSALLNHTDNPRPGTEALAKRAVQSGFGVFAAHTGTLLGAICRKEDLSSVYEQVCEVVSSIGLDPRTIEQGSLF